MKVFGPIPSRRLGRSLGINNIPPKTCSYSCIYCQIGKTNSMSITRQEFFSPDEIFTEISGRINQLKINGDKIDYLTFVPDGEPTLDINLGKIINLLKPLGIKIAVITNSSLLWKEDVRQDLMNADWVSVKVDTIDEKIWRKIDRPHGSLSIEKIIKGIEAFADSFKGMLVTETMLVKDINDSEKSLLSTAELISRINPGKSYILIPTRPPAELPVEKPTEESLNTAYQIYSSILPEVELITGNEGNNFSFSCDAEKELLAILAVHPMNKEAVSEFLTRSNSKWDLVYRLIKKKRLKEVTYSNDTFLLRTL